ncbi:MAG: signal peptidase I, partial [Gaiellaceae bacterium]
MSERDEPQDRPVWDLPREEPDAAAPPAQPATVPESGGGPDAPASPDATPPAWDVPREEPRYPPPSADTGPATGWPPPAAPSGSVGQPSAPDAPPRHQSHNPVDRLTRNLPHGLRVTIDWAVTIIGAIAIVLLVKAYVINPYRIPSSSMEPTLHCAEPAAGCIARFSDRVLANRFVYHFRDPQRGDVIVFETPPSAQAKCGAGGTFVKRIVGLPGERV